ncbi:MAG: VOC family protein [Pseudomonadales bacterium]
MKARYVHTNLIARDWQRLAAFYTEVFGCRMVPPERDYQGAALDAGTALNGARLRGAHLLLPGFDAGGPTLEIYSYDQLESRPAVAVNRPGFGHIAFEVDDVPAAAQLVRAHGGAEVGQIVELTTRTGARVTWCYMTDPEGNVLELQSWSDTA